MGVPLFRYYKITVPEKERGASSLFSFVRKSTPLQTSKNLSFIVFEKYKKQFTNIFAKFFTFTNTCDTIRTDERRGCEHGQPHILLRKGFQ